MIDINDLIQTEVYFEEKRKRKYLYKQASFKNRISLVFVSLLISVHSTYFSSQDHHVEPIKTMRLNIHRKSNKFQLPLQ